MNLRIPIMAAAMAGLTAACGTRTPTGAFESPRALVHSRYDGGGMYGSGNLTPEPATSASRPNTATADSIEATVTAPGGGMYGSGN
jgi:hypothetical protein